MKEKMTKITYEAEGGENVLQTSKRRWFFASVFYIPAFIFIIIAGILLRLANFFLFDTHHFELKITPQITPYV